MKNLLHSIKFWISDTLASRGEARPADTSVAKAASDATHVSGAGGLGAGGGFSNTSSAYKHIASGAKNYAKSFKKR